MTRRERWRSVPVGEQQTDKRDRHPAGGVEERGGRRDKRPERAGDCARREVPRALQAGLEPERGPAEVLRGEVRNSDGLRRLSTPDRDPCGDEAPGEPSRTARRAAAWSSRHART